MFRAATQLAVALVFLAAHNTNVAEADQPFGVSVSSPAARIYSGAGQGYYATAVLPQGTKLEVYKSSGKFFAIRPPAESFSWVSAADVGIAADGATGGDASVGTILREGVPSRVGSLLSSERNVVHVRLHEGEQVQVLGKSTISGVDWLKIAPPAGEFRWVKQEDVVREGAVHASGAAITTEPIGVKSSEPATLPTTATANAKPIDTASNSAEAETQISQSSPGWVQANIQQQAPATPANDQAIELTQATSTVAAASSSTAVPSTSSDSKPQHPWQLIDATKLRSNRAAATPAPLSSPPLGKPTTTSTGWSTATTSPPAQRAVTTPGVASPPSANLPAPSVPRSLPLIANEPPAPLRPASSIAVGQPISDRLSAMEVELSRRVAEEPGRWSLTDLQQEIARLGQSPADHATRAALGSFAARTARFAQIANRYREARTVAPPVALTKQTIRPPETPANARQASQATQNTATTAERYDAIGVLREVVSSKRPDAPKFALVDAQGKVITFLTPQAGVDAKQHVGRQVGVSGTRGYMPQLRSRHVAATRIAQLPASPPAVQVR